MGKKSQSLAEMAAAAASGITGLSCPKCGCQDFKTYGTIPRQTSVFRYKMCRHCGHRVLTKSQTEEKIIREVDQRGDEGEEPFLALFA